MDNGTEAAVKFIVEGGHKIVALQFPDEMLETCVMITEKLQRELHKGQCQAQVWMMAGFLICMAWLLVAHTGGQCI